MGKKSINKSQSEEVTTKLNTLAVFILDDLLEAKRKGKEVNFEDFKTYLLAIKEIKDLVKINKKYEEDTWGEFFEQDDLGGVNMLTEIINNEE